ncbi:prohibitin family protein, partial [candidate division WOR-3 bacterium]|nr:prohibitin family protein [candidate division WOR-3 bacterium]
MMPILMVVIIAGIVLYLKFGPQLKEHKKAIIVSAIIIVILAILVGSIRIIPPGYVGVQVLLGKVQSRILPSGIHLVIPIVNVNKMSIRTQEYTMSSMKEEGLRKGDDAITALTKDGLSISLDLTVWFKLIDTEAGIVYETIGPDYIDKIVRPAIRTA